MPSKDHVSRFLSVYFSHKYFSEVEASWIRLSFIPSKYLKAKKVAGGKKGPPRKNLDGVSFDPGLVSTREFVLLGSECAGEEKEKKVFKILGGNQQGYDVYYFMNAVDKECKSYATNRDVVRRLWFGVDLDFQLPCSWEEMCSEFGLKPSLVISTSSRQGVKHHQILWGLEVGEEGEEELESLARKICGCFTSDNVADAKRILRLPGTVNWKGAQGDGSGRSESGLIWAADRALLYPVEEFEESVERFGRGELCRELERCGYREVRVGGRAAGERGEYGSWLDALNRAEKGEWTVGEGGRHNALCSWGVQMCAARMPWGEVEKKLEVLRVAGLEGGYEDLEDYARIVRGVRRKWEEIDSEVDAALGSDCDLGHCEIEEIGASSERDTESSDNSGNNSASNNSESGGGGSGGGDSPSNPDIHESINPSGVGDTTPQGSTDVNPWDYSVRLARRAEGESEKHWLDFLGNCLAAAIEFEGSDTASVVPLGRALWARLLWCGALRDRGYWAPMRHREPFSYWGFERLGDDAAKILIKDFLYQVSGECKRQRKKLKDNPAVIAQNGKRKKPLYLFPGLGVMEVKAVNDVLDRAAAVGSQEISDDGIISFQNGWFDLGLWSVVNGDGEKEESLEEKIRRCWTPNGVERCAGIRRSVSWMRWPHTCAVDFDLESAVQWASGERVSMPKSDYFFGCAFGDNERDIVGLMRIIGYCLLADNPCQKYFYFEGQAGTGKGTTAEIILALAGRHRAGRISAQRFESDAWLGPLEGRGPVLIDEAENVNVTQHKKMLVELARVTGESAVASRVLREDMRDIRSTQRFILTTNQNLETNDESGQQARRIVPLNFRYVPKKGPIPGLWRQIVREEGPRLATVGCLELAKVWRFQEGLFSEGLESAVAFKRGQERFKAVSRGLGEFISKIIEPGKGLSSSLLRAVCQLWINQERDRSGLGVGLHIKISKEMDILGYDPARITYPMSEIGAKKHTNRGMGYAGLGIKVSGLLDELGLDETMFVEKFTELVEPKTKEWFLAEALLELEDRGLWLRNSGEDSWVHYDINSKGKSDLNI